MSETEINKSNGKGFFPRGISLPEQSPLYWVDIAKSRLFGDSDSQVGNLKIFHGSSRDITPEQLAEQVNKIIGQLEAGDYDVPSNDAQP